VSSSATAREAALCEHAQTATAEVLCPTSIPIATPHHFVLSW